MNIKILETKLQTIFEDDEFTITKKNLIEKIQEKLSTLLKNITEYNSAMTAISILEDEYSGRFVDDRNSLLYSLKCNEIEMLLDDEISSDRSKFLDFIEEVFTNQDLYNFIKKATPSIVKLVDKLNKYDCFSLSELMDRFDDEINVVSVEDLEDRTVFEYLDSTFLCFKELLVPTEADKKFVINAEESESNKETAGN